MSWLGEAVALRECSERTEKERHSGREQAARYLGQIGSQRAVQDPAGSGAWPGDSDAIGSEDTKPHGGGVNG